MFKTSDYEFLFYVTPKEYRAVLGWDGQDPMRLVNRKQRTAFQPMLKDCPLPECIQFLVTVFSDKYPNVYVLNMIVSTFNEKKEEMPKRKDINKILFTYVENGEDDWGSPLFS